MTSKNESEKIHGTCIAAGSKGVLLLGASGSGKSDLALRLISRGAVLVADDVVMLRKEEDYIIANADTATRGLLEVRGVGLVHYPVANHIPVVLVVRLVVQEKVERLPTPAVESLLGVSIPAISISGIEASSPDKVHAALHALLRNRLHTGFLPDAAKT